MGTHASENIVLMLLFTGNKVNGCEIATYFVTQMEQANSQTNGLTNKQRFYTSLA